MVSKRIIGHLDEDIPKFVWGIKFDQYKGLVTKKVEKLTWNHITRFYELKVGDDWYFTNVIGIDDQWVEDDGEFYFTSLDKSQVELVLKAIKQVQKINKGIISMAWRMCK